MKLNPGNCNKSKEFIALYQRLLDTQNPKRILEIGVQRGDSLRMWANAFPNAEVIGLDLEIKAGTFPANVKTVNGNQNDTALLQSLGRFDFIVDDGSHTTHDQQVSFETLFPNLNSGGLYVIEDLETSFMPQYIDTPVTTWEFLIKKLERMPVSNHQEYRFAHEGIRAITFERDIAVIEKL